MSTLLILAAVIIGAYIAWRLIRVIPWGVVASMTLMVIAALLLAHAAIHFDIDVYAVLGHLAPFGETRA